MHVVVLTKMTPDTAASVTVDGAGNVSWGNQLVVNPWDEYSITEAVLLKGEHGVKATIMTVGPEEHVEALKHGIAIGCDAAVRIWDDALAGHDSLVYAKTVAAAVEKLDDVSLVLFGRELSDNASDAHIFQTARKLGWPLLGSVAQIEAVDFAAKTITVKRQTDAGMQTITSQLPAVVSVIKDINEPKYPTFIGIRKAGKVDMPVWDAGALGLDADALQNRAELRRYEALPASDAEVEIIEGATAQEQAEKLVARLLEEKVL